MLHQIAPERVKQVPLALSLREGYVYTLQGEEQVFVREVAVLELRKLAGRSCDFDPRGPEESRAAGLARWRKWLETR